MLTTIVVVIVAALAAILAFAATRPDTFRVQRTAIVDAPPAAVYALIEDLHRWAVWSPWEKLDPKLQRTYSGAASGRGAVYEWSGDRKVGQGRMEITACQPAAGVTIKLDFIKPFEAHNTAEFVLAPAGKATSVTWTMLGSQPYPAKLMGVFLSMDKMIGKDFEAGLANIKRIVER